MSTENNIYNNDDVTLKDLILRFGDFRREIFKNKLTILLFIIPFVLYFSYKSIVQLPTYTAELTFMLNTNEGVSLGGLGGLLGQFGLGGKGEYSKEKMMSLNKSRRIIGHSIFKKVTINGNEDLLANHLINQLDSLDKWTPVKWYMKPFAKANILEGFRFKESNIDSFNELSNAALISLFETLVGDFKHGETGIMSNGFDVETGIMHIDISTNDPQLSIALANNIFDELSAFYVEKTIEKQKVTFEILKEKTDSIRNALSNRQAELANFEDRALGLWTKSSRLRKVKLQQEVKKLMILYGELLKNLEIADFTLKNKTPFVQAIDRPLLPLEEEKTSLFKAILIGLILGLFIGVIFVITRKTYRDALA